MALLYKKTEDGKAIEADAKGLPVVIDDADNNKEFGIDAVHLYGKVPALQEEAKGHRLKANEHKDALEAYKGIEDPAAAIAALDTVKNLESGDLTAKAELDRIQKETEEAWKGKITELNTSHQEVVKDFTNQVNTLEGEVFNALVSTQFSKSPYFTGKEPITNLIPDIAESYFGKQFKAEKTDDGKRRVVGYVGGKAIYSKERPGEYADFDEAIGLIIDQYPMKDRILHGSQGSGATGGQGRRHGKVITKGDNDSFINNLDEIAKGKVKVGK